MKPKSILPKKDKQSINPNDWDTYEAMAEGYNQAISDCEQALKKAVDEVCDEKRLANIMIIQKNNKYVQGDEYEKQQIVGEYKQFIYDSVKTIAQHIRGCFYKEVL